MFDTETARTKNIRAVLVETVDFFMLFWYTFLVKEQGNFEVTEDTLWK